MNRLQYASRILGALLREKSPPLARYAVTMAAASFGAAGGTVREIAVAIGEPDPRDFGGSLTKIEDAGMIRRVPGSQPIRYTPTEAGLRLIAPLINPAPVPA